MEGANILYLVIGGLLAIGGHLIIERIKKRGQKEEFKKGLLAEVKYLRFQLATTVYQLSGRVGTYDRDLLNWIHDIYTEYSPPKMLTEIKRLLGLSDEQIAELGKKEKEKFERGLGLSLKKYSLPFLDPNIGSLSLLDMELQSLIIVLRDRLDRLNQEIDFSRSYFWETFRLQPGSQECKSMRRNLRSSYQMVLDTSHDIADQITYLIKELDVTKRYGGMTEEAIIYGIVKCIAQLKEDLLRKKKAR